MDSTGLTFPGLFIALTTLVVSLGSKASRSSQQVQQYFSHLIGEFRIVDVVVQLDQRDARFERFLDCIETGLIGLRVPKISTDAIQHRNTPEWNHNGNRARGGVSGGGKHVAPKSHVSATSDLQRLIIRNTTKKTA